MAAVDVQWPSEDEDFDAVTTKAPPARKKGRATADSVEEQAPEKPQETEPTPSEEPVSIAVNDAEPEVEEPAFDTVPETTEEETPVTEAAGESEVPSEESSEAEVSSQEPVRPTTTFAPETLDAHAELPQEDIPPLVKAPRKWHPTPKQFARFTFEAALVIAVVSLGLYAWNLTTDRDNLQKQVTQLNENPQIVAQRQTDELIKKVGALMQLPSGEVPTVANVSDAAKAKQQSPFFNNAQNGDKVLMYVKAGEAILYRPSTNKIVLVAPLTFSDNAASASQATTPAAATKTTR